MVEVGNHHGDTDAAEKEKPAVAGPSGDSLKAALRTGQVENLRHTADRLKAELRTTSSAGPIENFKCRRLINLYVRVATGCGRSRSRLRSRARRFAVAFASR